MRQLWDTNNDNIKAAAVIVKQIPLAEIVRVYAHREPKLNRCRCPICNNGRPDAFSIDTKKNRYHCFRCGDSGDGIQLAQKLLGLNFPQAVERLNADFHMGVDLDGPSDDTQAALRAAKTLREEKDRRHRAALDNYHKWNDLLLTYDQWLQAFPPGDKRHDEAERELVRVSYKRDCAFQRLKSLEQ